MSEIKSGVYIWLIILAILGVLICAAIVYKFKKCEKTTTEIVLTILAVLIAYVGLAFAIWNYDSKNDPPPSGGNDTSGIVITVNGDVGGRIISVGGNVTENTTCDNYIKPDEISLASADRKLEIKDYASAAEIYLQILGKDPKDSIALCNLGYIYANGLDTEVDLQCAIEHYNKSISQGSSMALRNELALCLCNDISIEQVEELLRIGIKEEDEVVCKFVAACKQGDISMTAEDAIAFCKDVQEISADELWGWREGNLVKLYSTPTNTNVLRYTKVSVGTETTETFAARYTIYQTEDRYCPYIELLQSGFDKTV